MRKFFSDLSGKEAPSVLDVGIGAAGRALGLAKRSALTVVDAFKKPQEVVQTDSCVLFNCTMERMHSVVALLVDKQMDSQECAQLRQSQQTLQHMAQHLQVPYLLIS
jgi:hypothetical protein